MIPRNAPADAPSRVARRASLLLSRLRKTRQWDTPFWGVTLLPSAGSCSGRARDTNTGHDLPRSSEDRARRRFSPGMASRALPAGMAGGRRSLGKALLIAAASSASIVEEEGAAVLNAVGWAAGGRRVRAVSTLMWKGRKDGVVVPNRESYRAAIQEASARGAPDQSEEALALLAEMTMVGLVPDIQCYNAALGACANDGQWEQAFRLLRKMQAKGGVVEPDIASYNAVLTACGNVKLLPRPPPPYTATPLRGNNGGRGGVSVSSRDTSKLAIPLEPCAQQALSLLSEMWDTSGGVTPTDESYGACINACGNSGRHWGQVMTLLREVTSRGGVTPGVRSYTAAIKAGRNGYRWRETLALLRQMRESEEGDSNGTRMMTEQEDTAVFNAAITACKNGGDRRHVLSLLEDMGNLGVTCDVTSYNEAIRALRHRRARRPRPKREAAGADTFL